MVLINLLPDSKLEGIRAQRAKRFALGIAIAVVAVAVAVPLILLAFVGGQKLALSSTQKNIDQYVAEIQGTENIETILTTKEHLDSLPDLYAQRAFYTNLLDALPDILPTQLRLTGIELTSDGTVNFTGVATSNAVVQKFVAATEALTYEPVAGESSADMAVPLFSDVVLNSVSPDSEDSSVFDVSATFDGGILNENR